jgi:hypothetical protein
MNILKTPKEKLMEEAGMAPSSPGMLNTPKQMLVKESGVVPHMAKGGQPSMSVQDMLAYLVNQGVLPQHYAPGGTVKNIALQSAIAAPLMSEDLSEIGQDIKNEKYLPAAMKSGAVGYSAFAPFNPLTALISGMTYSPEAGAGSTLDEWMAAREAAKNPPKKTEAPSKKELSLLKQKTMALNK